jgi:hypothetical protein
MKITKRSGGIAGVCVGVGMSVAVLASPNIDVTSRVQDVALNVAPALQIQSDGLGVYQTNKSLVSELQNFGGFRDWVLDSLDLSKATRTVYLGFNQPVPGSAPGGADPIPLPNSLYLVHVAARCDLDGKSMLTLAPGQTMTCPLAIEFYSGGTQYYLHMNPGITEQGTIQWPETNYANISCSFPTSRSGPCSQWILTPSGSYTINGVTQFANRTKLVRGLGGANDLGDFYFSFEFVVTNP